MARRRRGRIISVFQDFANIYVYNDIENYITSMIVFFFRWHIPLTHPRTDGTALRRHRDGRRFEKDIFVQIRIIYLSNSDPTVPGAPIRDFPAAPRLPALLRSRRQAPQLRPCRQGARASPPPPSATVSAPWRAISAPSSSSAGAAARSSIKLIPSAPDIEIGGLQVMSFDPVNYYCPCLIVVSISLLILYRPERSRIGLTFHAIHWKKPFFAALRSSVDSSARPADSGISSRSSSSSVSLLCSGGAPAGIRKPVRYQFEGRTHRNGLHFTVAFDNGYDSARGSGHAVKQSEATWFQT